MNNNIADWRTKLLKLVEEVQVGEKMKKEELWGLDLLTGKKFEWISFNEFKSKEENKKRIALLKELDSKALIEIINELAIVTYPIFKSVKHTILLNGILDRLYGSPSLGCVIDSSISYQLKIKQKITKKKKRKDR